MNCEAFFSSLGAAIRADFAAVNFDSKKFSEIAERHLLRAKPADNVSLADIVEYSLFKRDRWVHNHAGDFGQPNITLYHTPHFYIEALFWLEGSTALHQHGFSGAFSVLSGGSIHSTYSFELREALNQRLRLGTLHHKNIEILHPGAVRRIDGGPALIHALFHLDYPSISIVVRTPVDRDTGIQYSYYPPHVSMDPFDRRPIQTLTNRTFEMLRKLDHPELNEWAIRYLKDCDPLDAFDFFLAQTPPKDPIWFTQVLGSVTGASYQKAIPEMIASLVHQYRTTQILVLRKKVTERDLRTVLGFLGNAPSLTALNTLLRSAFPGREPKEVLLDALKRFATMEIGFPAEDATLEIIGYLLDGMSDQQVHQRLVQEYGEAEVAGMTDAISESLRLLRGHYLLAPVLAGFAA